MIDGLKPYPAYKDSGVPWLGHVPAHWEIRRNKLLLTEVDVRSQDGSEELLSVSQYTGVNRRRDKLSEDGELLTKASSLIGYKCVRAGDLVMNIMLAWNGSLGVSDIGGIVSPAYCVFRSRGDVEPRFLHYLLRTPLLTGVFKMASTGVVDSRLRLYPDVFLRLPSLRPPPMEQSTIARFLNHADHRIRRYIAAKRKLITLLNEQKQAIINRAVTRGLDPNVPLKPSGVEWLGDVPEHWRVSQVRRLVSLVTSGSRGWASYYSDTGAVFLQSGNLGRSMSLNLSFIQRVDPPEGSEGERTRVHRDDILVCITGALTGNVVLVDSELSSPAYVNQHVALVRPVPSAVHPRYLASVLFSRVGTIQFKSSEYGGTKQGLGLNDVKSALVTLPPLSEQIAISSVLDAELARLGDVITNIQREIHLVREYRTRLIADVVTGKLDVRDVAANLPDEAEESVPVEEEHLLGENGVEDEDAEPEGALPEDES